MAYLTILASVPLNEIERLIADSYHLLSPSRHEFVSHYLAYSVKIQPLGKLLSEAIDGGKLINTKLWHPYRAPIAHWPDAVRDLHLQIKNEWEILFAQQKIPEDDWYRIEIEKVLNIYSHASQYNECVVNVIHPPADAQRANRVWIPIQT